MRSYLFSIVVVVLLSSCSTTRPAAILSIYADSIVNGVSHKPIGINLNYFMDDGRFPNANRSTTEALRAMGVKYLRYPGGDKSDFNLFSVPPYEKSNPVLARTGKGAVDDYENILLDYRDFKYDVLDFDEFMVMCRELDAEPVVVVPADGYLKDYPEGCTWTDRESLIKHAAEWVKYANIKQKYNVKYWMIGNECWNNNNPNSTPEIYAQDALDFSRAMKAVDPSIYTIPNGHKVNDFEKVITIAGDHIDYLCLSNYPTYDYKAGYLTYRDTLQDLMDPVRQALTAIDKYATSDQKKKLKLIVSEFGPFDWNYKWPMINDMGHNLANFEIAGQQLLTPEIAFACFWNTRWTSNDSIQNEVWDALDSNGNFNANGYGLAILGNFLGEKMIHTASTLHFRSFASISAEEKKLFVYLLNKTDDSATIHLDIRNGKIRSVSQAWELFGKNSDDTDPIWQRKLMKNAEDINLKQMSITVLEYNLQ